MNTQTDITGVESNQKTTGVRNRSSARKAPDLSFALGLPFHRVSNEGALEECLALIGKPETRHLVTANLDFVAQSAKSSELRKLIFHAHRVFCDGQPVVWSSKLFGRPIPERVAGSDLTPKLLKECAENGHRIFILGTDESTMERLDTILPEQYPGLEVAGSIAPPYSPIEDWDNEAYTRQIRESGADVLFVCLGFPKQDVWIDRHLDQLGDVSIAIGVGASFDFIAGKQKRAPRVMQKVGMEWSWRLLSDPKRLLRRYSADFVSLVTQSFLQWNCFTQRPEKGRSELRMLTGTHVQGSITVENTDELDIELAIRPDEISSAILDLSGTDRLNQELMAEVTTFMRNCRSTNVAPALFNAPAALEKYIERLGLADEVPAFTHPRVAEGWARNLSSNISDRVQVKSPARLDSDTQYHGLVGDLRTLLGIRRFADLNEIALDLSACHNVSMLSALRLARMQRKGIAISGMTPEVDVKLLNANSKVADLFEMIQLDESITDTTGKAEILRGFETPKDVCQRSRDTSVNEVTLPA